MASASLTTPTLGRQARNFGLHFAEMCISMCAGGGLLYALLFVAGPATIGYTDPRQAYPELSLLVVAIAFTVPMAAWMWFRGMPWRPIAEMSAASLAVAALFLILGGTGIFTRADVGSYAGLAFCGPACAAMLAAMLLRFNFYTGRSGGHRHAAV
jgi:O-antigen/teichoic acid export membrane protein